MDLTPLKRAGVSQGQFADLLGVSRVTVNTWVVGRRAPTPKIRGRIHAVLRLLDEAVESGALPVQVLDHKAATSAVLNDIRTRIESEA